MKRLALILLTVAGPAISQHDHSQQAAAAPSPEAPAAQRPTGREWTRQPILTPAMSRGGERGTAALKLSGIDAAELTVFAAGGPDERRRVAYPVGPEGAKIEAAAPKVGNYHWVIARQESEAEVRVASTAWYFSNPGPAPTELLKQAKHELEIVPYPLPREHSAYREAEKRQFLVRWNGAPLAAKALTLETEFGSRSSFLGTEHEADGKHYLTAFNYTYSPDPDRTRSLAWGVAFGVIGMVAALPLLRRRTATADSAEKKNA